APWSPRVRQTDGSISAPDAPWVVGCPSMNGLVAHLQADLRVRFGRAVAAIERCPDGWRALDEAGTSLGTGEKLVLAIPAPQSARLLQPHEDAFRGSPGPEIGRRLADVGVEATWTLMIDGVDRDPGFDVAVDPNESIRWLAREASRPDRPDHGAWTMHASPSWTERHLELAKEEVEPLLRALAADVLGAELRAGDVHRWRFGLTTEPLGTSHLRSDDGSLLICGDWCLGGRVEHALESGIAAAGAVLRDPGAAVLDEGVGLLFGEVG
ncbi:MAG: FAD-dependent oxidoreductase, partial [Planctomycetota bacterium]|nr:FAD-dependent oxidoreductase [Planctomycetota bacterium]